MEGSGCDFEHKYFTTVSLDTEESRGDNSDESHVVDIEDANLGAASSDGPTEADMLLEEPELEYVTEVDVESSGDDLDDDDKCITLIERTDAMVHGQSPIIISEVADPPTIIDQETARDSARQIDSKKYKATVYIEDDEV